MPVKERFEISGLVRNIRCSECGRMVMLCKFCLLCSKDCKCERSIVNIPIPKFKYTDRVRVKEPFRLPFTDKRLGGEVGIVQGVYIHNAFGAVYEVKFHPKWEVEPANFGIIILYEVCLESVDSVKVLSVGEP